MKELHKGYGKKERRANSLNTTFAVWIFAQSHFLSCYFSGLASFDVLFLSSTSTSESQRLSQFSHPVLVFLVANKNLSRKNIYWENIQRLLKGVRLPEPLLQWATVVPWTSQGGRPCWLQPGLDMALCACLSAAFFSYLVSCVTCSRFSLGWEHVIIQALTTCAHTGWQTGGNDGLPPSDSASLIGWAPLPPVLTRRGGHAHRRHRGWAPTRVC